LKTTPEPEITVKHSEKGKKATTYWNPKKY